MVEVQKKVKKGFTELRVCKILNLRIDLLLIVLSEALLISSM